MRIGVIMGGVSSEREVSIKSGKEVLKYLNKDKYDDVTPIIINTKKEVFTKVKDIDFAFIALHGQFGEDGTIQGILEGLGIPYSGCGVLTSAICMNKSLTKMILKQNNIPTAPWITVKSVENINYSSIEELGYPIFIKPNSGGSSVATYFVDKKENVLDAIAEGLRYDNEIILEKYICGEEITSFVLNGEVFPTLTIKYKKGNYFDYSSKYDEGGADESLSLLKNKLQEKVNEISKTIWDILGCKGYCRIDMIVSDGVPYVLEINTLPGLTKTSLIPKSAEMVGLSFSELLDKIIEYSL